MFLRAYLRRFPLSSRPQWVPQRARTVRWSRLIGQEQFVWQAGTAGSESRALLERLSVELMFSPQGREWWNGTLQVIVVPDRTGV